MLAQRLLCQVNYLEWTFVASLLIESVLLSYYLKCDSKGKWFNVFKHLSWKYYFMKNLWKIAYKY